MNLWEIVQAIFSDIWAYKNDTLSGIFWNKVLELQGIDDFNDFGLKYSRKVYYAL